MLTVDKVYNAKQVLKNIIRRTDLIQANKILCSNNIYIKTENLQVTGSFKVRGSAYKIEQLTRNEKNRGIIACSAGNHSQGVALAARQNMVNATIFIPKSAPISKIEATKKLGAKVILIDGTYDDAYEAALMYREKTNMTLIHPFDDVDVIAGQGTIGLELLEDFHNLEAVVLPVGGGGLAAGAAYIIKTLNPNCRVYGVQAKNASAMYDSLNEGKIVKLESVSTIADGIAVKAPGELTYKLCKQYLDGMITVSEDEIASAILTLMENQKLIAEGAGAASVAAVMHNKLPIEDKNVACIVSGGNIDMSSLSKLIFKSVSFAI